MRRARSSSPARLNVDPGPNASPRCPAPVGRSIRSLLAVNTSLTKIGSLITTARPKSGKLTVNACRTVGAEEQTFPALQTRTRCPAGSSVSVVLAVAVPPRLSLLPCLSRVSFLRRAGTQKVSDVPPSGGRLAPTTRPATATAERPCGVLQPVRLRVGTDFTSCCTVARQGTQAHQQNQT